MKNTENNPSWYLTVDGNKVAVTQEVYLAYRAANNRVHKLAYREHRCSQPYFAYCDGDCWTCRFYNIGIVLSTDAPLPEYLLKSSHDTRFEDAALDHISMGRIYEQADQLVRDGSTILQMRFEENMSLREIADRLHVSHTAINKRMKILLQYFKNNYEVFFE